MELLQDLNRKDGLTVVVTLHQVDFALRYCSRIVALQEGKLAYDGPPSGLDRNCLVQIYGPEFEDVLVEGQQP
jgi:phosphonate transport system ATP-binding protein